jgi:uncharacterized membrane protein
LQALIGAFFVVETTIRSARIVGFRSAMNDATHATGSARRPRRHGLDALRGLAVLLMIEQHVGIWLWEGPGRGESLADHPVLVGFNALGGGAAPLFVCLAGVGSALFSVAGRPRSDRTMVRRGLVLMLFGLVLNLASPSWFSWGSWFVLHMMGFAMALAPLWRRMSTRSLLMLCGGVLVLTVAAQHSLATPSVLDNPRMRDVSMPGGVLRLALVEGQFPILPWLTFYLAGFVAGRWVVADRPQRIIALGAGFMALGGLGNLAYKASLWSGGFSPEASSLAFRAFGLQLGFFPASIAIVGLLLGGALVLVGLMTWWERRRPLTERNPMVTMGRASLTLLMLHVPLFRELTRPIGLWRGLSAETTLVAVLAVIAIAIAGSMAWQRIGYRGGAEWLLRRLAG